MDLKYHLFFLIALYLLTRITDLIISILNYRHLHRHGNDIPEEFAGVLDPETMDKTKSYTEVKIKFSIYNEIYSQAISLIFIFGFLNIYNELLLHWKDEFNWPFFLWGTIFFLILSYGKAALNIPFELYGIFGIEKRFNFNKMTPALWIKDACKRVLVSGVISSILLCGGFMLVEWLPNFWWMPVWGFFFIFSLFIVYISPYILDPLFNKFTPLKDHELAAKVKETVAKAGIKLKGVYLMDASKRTRHSNAYFTGIGKVKRIIIYDTLLECLETDELLAVLAHEAAHCKKKHVLKNIIIFEGLSIIGAYLSFVILKSSYLADVFGLSKHPVGEDFFAQMVLLSFAAGIVLWAMPLIFNLISRIYEHQADMLACHIMGSGKQLASAMVKLSKDNLSNLHPHKLYALFNYSHPPVIERVRYLNNWKP